MQHLYASRVVSELRPTQSHNLLFKDVWRLHWFLLLLILVPNQIFCNSYFMKFIVNEIKSTALSTFHINSAAISLGIPDHLLMNANSSVSQMTGTLAFSHENMFQKINWGTKVI